MEEIIDMKMVVVGIAEHHLIGEETRSAAGNVGRLAFVSAFCGCCPEVSSGPLGKFALQ